MKAYRVTDVDDGREIMTIVLEAPIVIPVLDPPASQIITTYSQRDPRWAGEFLGTGNTTIGRYGCTLCCMAMASERATGKVMMPSDANKAVKVAGGFSGPNGNLLAWEKGGAALGLKYEWHVYCDSVAAPMLKIIQAVDDGKFVLLKMDFDPQDVDIDQHWVLIRAQKGEGQTFVIDDPWTGEAHDLPPAYCRAGWTAARAIFGAVCFSGMEGE